MVGHAWHLQQIRSFYLHYIMQRLKIQGFGHFFKIVGKWQAAYRLQKEIVIHFHFTSFYLPVPGEVMINNKNSVEHSITTSEEPRSPDSAINRAHAKRRRTVYY